MSILDSGSPEEDARAGGGWKEDMATRDFASDSLAAIESLTEAYREANNISDIPTRLRVKSKILETQEALLRAAGTILSANIPKPR